jgi:hypothetical protein
MQMKCINSMVNYVPKDWLFNGFKVCKHDAMKTK